MFPTSMRLIFRASISWVSLGDQASGMTWVPLGRMAGSRMGPAYLATQVSFAWSATSWVRFVCGAMTGDRGHGATGQGTALVGFLHGHPVEGGQVLLDHADAAHGVEPVRTPTHVDDIVEVDGLAEHVVGRLRVVRRPHDEYPGSRHPLHRQRPPVSAAGGYDAEGVSLKQVVLDRHMHEPGPCTRGVGSVQQARLGQEVSAAVGVELHLLAEARMSTCKHLETAGTRRADQVS